MVRSDDVVELYHVTTANNSRSLEADQHRQGRHVGLDAPTCSTRASIASREVRGVGVGYGAGQWLLMLWTDNRSDTSDEIAHYACRDGARFDLQGCAIQNESRPAVIYCQVQGRFVAVSRETASSHDTQIRDAGAPTRRRYTPPPRSPARAGAVTTRSRSPKTRSARCISSHEPTPTRSRSASTTGSLHVRPALRLSQIR